MDTPTHFSYAFFTNCFIVDYKKISYFVDLSDTTVRGTWATSSARCYKTFYNNKKFALLYPEQHTKILEWLKTNT